jgi:hypothetical protein
MAVGKRNATKLGIADIIVENQEGLPVLLVEVKRSKADSRTTDQVTKYLRGADLPAIYTMIVDPERIEVFVWDGNQLTGPVFSAEASPILKYYSEYYEDFLARGIRRSFLETLVKAWLRDLDYQWKTKSSNVPGADALAEIGLLSQLKDSTIRYEVPIRGNPAPFFSVVLRVRSTNSSEASLHRSPDNYSTN